MRVPDLYDVPTRVWLLLAAGAVFFLLAFVWLSRGVRDHRRARFRGRGQGGYWCLLMAGLVAAICFVGPYHWQGGIVAPLAAHLALDLAELIHASATRGDT